MNFKNQQASYDSDLSAIEQEMPCQCLTIANVPFVGQRGSVTLSFLGNDAGYIDQADWTLVVRISQFSDPSQIPNVEEMITVSEASGNVNYRVKTKEVSPDGIQITFGIKSDS